MPARARTSHGCDVAPKTHPEHIRTVPALGSTTVGPTPRRVGHIPSLLCDVLGGSSRSRLRLPHTVHCTQNCTRCAAYRVRIQAAADFAVRAPPRKRAATLLVGRVVFRPSFNRRRRANEAISVWTKAVACRSWIRSRLAGSPVTPYGRGPLRICGRRPDYASRKSTARRRDCIPTSLTGSQGLGDSPAIQIRRGGTGFGAEVKRHLRDAPGGAIPQLVV